MHPDEILRRELLDDHISGRSRQHADNHAYAMAFAQWFGLPSQPARLLVSLYQAKDDHLTIAQLGDGHSLTPGAIHRYICLLRQALDTEAIDTQRLVGYRLTEDGQAECRAALWQMGEVLRRAG